MNEDENDIPLGIPDPTKIALLEEKLHNLRREIDKQAREYERRLSELNHAHEKQVADQSTYISNDRFIGWQNEINTWKGEISRKMTLLEGHSGGVTSAQGLVLQVLPMLIALASVAALIWHR